jgi:hypothetical protein
MIRTLFIGILLGLFLSACSSPIVSLPGPKDTPIPGSTDTPIPLTAAPERPSTAVPLPEPPGDFEYSSVAEALANLRRRDGISIEVMQGWIIAREPDGLTTWSFAPPDHPAHPAVAKRVLYRDQDGWHLRMDVRCEAQTAACDEFVRHFEALNEPIYQMIEMQQ